MKNVLILVMSAQQPPWGAMIDTSKATWDSLPCEGVGTIYYMGNPVKPDTINEIYFPYDNLLEQLGNLTLCTFERALTFGGWTYIARVNSSCYVHKRRLRDHCQTLPETGVMRGLIAEGGYPFKFMWGGGHYIYSRDVIEKIVANRDKWVHTYQEDVAVSKLALDVGIPMTDGSACSINKSPEGWHLMEYGGGNGVAFSDAEWSKVNEASTQYFFRVKCDDDRSVDLYVMRKLFDNLQP